MVPKAPPYCGGASPAIGPECFTGEAASRPDESTNTNALSLG